MGHKKIREHLHSRLGIVDPIDPKPIGNLLISEKCPEFRKMAQDRLIMGAIRYGRMGALDKPEWDRIPDMIKRLKTYRLTGNLELLVDVHNLCELEFVEGKHPRRHFDSKDDGSHTKIKN